MLVRNKRNYINCSNAADATDKIIINGDYVFYFGDFESASDWLNNFANSGNFHYEWLERELDWETGDLKRNWVDIEIGNTENIKVFATAFGL